MDTAHSPSSPGTGGPIPNLDVKEALDTLLYDDPNSVRLRKVIVDLNKCVGKTEFAEEFLEKGGLDVLIQCLKNTQGSVQGHLLQILRSLLVYVNAMDQFADSPDLVLKIYALLSPPREGEPVNLTVAKAALEILTVICGMLKNGHDLVNDAAKHRGGVPYALLIPLLGSSDLLTARSTLLFMNVLMKKRKEADDFKAKKLLFRWKECGLTSVLKRLATINDEAIAQQLTVFQKMTAFVIPRSWEEASKYKSQYEELKKKYDMASESLFVFQQQQAKMRLLKGELSRAHETIKTLSLLQPKGSATETPTSDVPSTLYHPAKRFAEGGGVPLATLVSNTMESMDVTDITTEIANVRKKVFEHFLNSPDLKEMVEKVADLRHPAVPPRKVPGGGGALGKQESTMILPPPEEEDILPPPDDGEDVLPPPPSDDDDDDDELPPPPEDDDEEDGTADGAPPSGDTAAAGKSGAPQRGKGKGARKPAPEGVKGTPAALGDGTVRVEGDQSTAGGDVTREGGVREAADIQPAAEKANAPATTLGETNVTAGYKTEASTTAAPTAGTGSAETITDTSSPAAAAKLPIPKSSPGGKKGLPPMPGGKGKLPLPGLGGAQKPQDTRQYYKGPAPTKKMRPLHWTRVKLDDMTGTLWGRIHDTDEYDCTFDYKEFEVMFSVQEKQKEEKKKKAAVVYLFDPQVFQNLSILLHRLPTIPNIQRAVLELDNETLNKDALTAILAQFPTAETKKSFANNASKKPIEQYEPPEQFVSMILTVEEFEKRCQAWLFTMEWEDSIQAAMKPILRLTEGLNAVLNSKYLPYYFGLLINFGNMMNHGTNKGNVPAVTMNALSSIESLKDNRGKVTLLNHLINTVKVRNPDALSLHEELLPCNAAAKISMEEVEESLTQANKEIMEFHKRCGVVKKTLEESGIAQDDPFIPKMANFHIKACAQLQELQSVYDRCKKSYEELIAYLGMPKGSELKPREVFEALVPFAEKVKKISNDLQKEKKRQSNKGQRLDNNFSNMVGTLQESLVSA